MRHLLIKRVSAVTFAVKKENRWQEQFLIGSRHMPPFSEGAGTSVHPHGCQRILNTPVKILNNIILFMVAMDIKSSFQLTLWLEERRVDRQMDFEALLK